MISSLSHHSNTPVLHYPNLLLGILAPQLHKESFVDQLLHETVVKELFGLSGFGLGIFLSDVVESHLEPSCFTQRNFPVEVVTVNQAAIEHALVFDLGVFGKNS